MTNMGLFITICYECGHPLDGPKCPSCNPDQSSRIAELEAALMNEYSNLVFMVENGIIPNVLDDFIHVETRRVLGDKAEKLKL